MKGGGRIARLSLGWRVGLFTAGLVFLWLPWALLVVLTITEPNQRTIAAMGSLFLVFFGWLWLWGRHVHGISHIWQHYGLRWGGSQGREWCLGLLMGWGLVALLFGAQWALGWLHWQETPSQLPRWVAEGALLGLGVAFAEELLFRGWLLDEWERNAAAVPARWGSALVFAVLHYLKPLAEVVQMLPQFVGLWLLGVVLALAKQRTHQLALPMGLHGGLVWSYYLVNSSQWVVYTDRVPAWVTGINGNPLAGVMGLLMLGGLLALLQRSLPESPVP